MSTSTPKINVNFPPKFKSLFRPHRYKVYYGGRGSAKSWSVARFLILQSLRSPIRILCTREFQNSISASVLQLIASQIKLMKLDALFDVQKNTIKSITGSDFIFEGLRHNVTKIKSMEGIQYCWIEEGEKISAESLDVLIPTIRKPGSEIIITFNPDSLDDPVYQRYVVNPPDGCITQKVNYFDNKHFPDVLRREMEYMKRVDYQRYLHIWEGEARTHSDAQIFNGKFISDDFETPDDALFYYGADFGFSTDPSTLIRCYIRDNMLYIDHEWWGLHVEIDELPEAYKTVPDSQEWWIEADSSRPDTISYIKRKGYRIRGVEKTKVEDGIEFLKSFEKIVVHSRCKHTLEEFKNYSYIVDRLSGNITPKIEDKHNHCIDALRYALVPVMRSMGSMSLPDFVLEGI